MPFNISELPVNDFASGADPHAVLLQHGASTARGSAPLLTASPRKLADRSASMAGATSAALLRGELFKAGDSSSSAFKLRWFELHECELRWCDALLEACTRRMHSPRVVCLPASHHARAYLGRAHVSPAVRDRRAGRNVGAACALPAHERARRMHRRARTARVPARRFDSEGTACKGSVDVRGMRQYAEPPDERRTESRRIVDMMLVVRRWSGPC